MVDPAKQSKIHYELMECHVEEFTTHQEYIDNPKGTAIRLGSLQQRLVRLLQLQSKVVDELNEIKALNVAEWKLKATDLFSRFNDNCWETIGAYQDLIDFQTRALSHAPEAQQVKVEDTVTSSKPKIKFPTIKLPEFDGSFEKWIPFRDVYESLVHNSTILTKIEKYHYLKTSIVLPAGQQNVLSNFTLSEESYEEAWKAVKERYDDTEKLKSHFLTSLLTMKRMTCESSTELRRILDQATTTTTSLALLQTTYDDLVVHVVLFRLDESTLKDWRKYIGKEQTSWAKLKEFLTQQWRTLDQMPHKKNASKPLEQKAASKPSSSSGKSFAESSLVTASSSSSASTCSLCKGTHRLYQCEKFRTLNVPQRFRHVQESKLCRNCLSSGHQQHNCPSANRCKECQQPHHTMLHRSTTSDNSLTSEPVRNEGQGLQRQGLPQRQNQPGYHPHTQGASQQDDLRSRQPFTTNSAPKARIPVNDNSTMHAALTSKQCKQALLSTVQAFAQDIRGSWQMIRILLDSGSQGNFATTALVQRLEIPLYECRGSITGINGKTSLIKNIAVIKFSSSYSAYEMEVECAILDDITGYLPATYVDAREMEIPKSLFLADPEFYKPAPIDMLLGTEVFHDCLLNGKIRIPNTPTLLETKFGWTLGGTYHTSYSSSSTLLSCFSQQPLGVEDIDKKLEEFMKIEDISPSKKLLTREEQYCEDTYKATTTRDDDGRYIVQLPVKNNINQLGNNYATAYRRFLFQEKIRLQDDELNKLYVEYMRNYIDTGHMQEVDSSSKNAGHYLPHHGVKKSSSTTTKVRPVFNASCKTETKLSLNDCLCVGPTVQSELFDILVRFLEMPFVLKSDIEKMYRQVFIAEFQRNYQKILWRENASEVLRHYQLNTVTFGVSSAAYLATRTLMQIALDNEEVFPMACKIIKESSYVDDFVFGVPDISQGLKLRNDIRYILLKSQMPTRKWSSNHPALLQGLHEKDIESIDENTTTVKTLGYEWNPTRDTLSVAMKSSPPHEGVNTKAGVLSEIASIYDPLGLFGPVVLKAKLFMKTLWRLHLSWSDPLPDEVIDSWNQFYSTLSSINAIEFKRHAVITSPRKIELHGFADASEEAYGCAIFIRSIDDESKIHTSLICSKSRVSPLKQKSIARLELCAATLLSKLITRIINILTIKIDQVTLWSDSMITLYWILTSPEKLSTFVGNRVSVIQEHTKKFVWKHIRGEDNPADLISRGLMPSEIADSRIWWNGPSFFSQPQSDWPESLITIHEDHPDIAKEQKKSHLVRSANPLLTLIETRFSKIGKLINCFACLRRLTVKSCAINKGKSITMEEKESAMFNIIRILQQSMFPEEYKFFANLISNPESRENFPSKSSIIMLSPYMDKVHRVMRVAGRLQSCSFLSEDQKHPIILPESHFAKLIIRHLHEKHSHPPANALLSIVREQYWPLKAKSIIRHVNRNCLRCFRVKPQFAEQFMGSLPAERVTMTPPFTTTAVDYTGHFNLRSSLTKKSSIVKGYIAMFKCMCTGAIHLEAVTELSTSAFIAAFERFISRRGYCSDIFSDNGTNFVGADNEFKKILQEVQSSIGEYLGEKYIKWHFSTPLAPHSGGYYEAGIKTVKHHLIRELGDYSYGFEQFATILTKVEAIVNSRPLTPLSDDPHDLRALTPAHFLIGRSLIAKPERNFLPVPQNRLDRWNRLQQLTQKIWNHWYHDYLHHLQTRPKHFQQKNDFNIGDMVIVKDNNLPPLKWLIGRVIKLLPGKDRIIRNVRIITSKGEKDRHIRYLCFLPFNDNTSPESKGGECVPDVN